MAVFSSAIYFQKLAWNLPANGRVTVRKSKKNQLMNKAAVAAIVAVPALDFRSCVNS